MNLAPTGSGTTILRPDESRKLGEEEGDPEPRFESPEGRLTHSGKRERQQRRRRGEQRRHLLLLRKLKEPIFLTPDEILQQKKFAKFRYFKMCRRNNV